jgi:hypothetical protein
MSDEKVYEEKKERKERRKKKKEKRQKLAVYAVEHNFNISKFRFYLLI